MAEGFEAYHVPQQSRRDKLRILSHPHHNPSDLFGFPSSNRLVKEEPPSNLIRFVGDSRHCHDPQQLYPPSDPQPSSSANPSPLQEDNTAFLCTRHDLGNVGRQGHPSYGSVDFAVSRCDGNIIGNNNARGLSLSLWSRVNSQGNDDRRNLPRPLELNLEGYGSALEYDGRGGRCFGEVLSGPLGPFTGYSLVLRGSRFLKPAQQLLEELCHAGRQVFALERASESDSSLMEGGGKGFGDADYQCGIGNEFWGKNSRLKSMLDEVCKRYKQYYQQLQNVVASFECVAGLGSAAPYVNLALKVMSKHFRCLKDAIMDQFQFTMKAHEKLRNTRVDVPRFETDERPLLGQRGIQNSGCLEHQPVWRPQRGLPERAVTVLRAWLFEHFLHPYPTDNDKLMLAKETGLSRSQVSNWFINARVRLWKPMVEEIHTLETQQTQKATQMSNDQFSLSSTVPSTSAPRIHDALAMRTAGELAADGSTVRNEQTHHLSYSEYQPSSLPHVVSESIRSVKTNSVTLTLGLHHQNNISMPVGTAQRVGLGRESNGEGYVMGGDYGMQEVQLLRDFGG